jgi:hypothetical protein
VKKEWKQWINVTDISTFSAKIRIRDFQTRHRKILDCWRCTVRSKLAWFLCNQQVQRVSLTREKKAINLCTNIKPWWRDKALKRTFTSQHYAQHTHPQLERLSSAHHSNSPEPLPSRHNTHPLLNPYLQHSIHPILNHYYYFQIRTAALKAYYAIWVTHSNSRHQTSPRVSPRESAQQRKVELWARNVQESCLNAEFHFTCRDILHALKLRHGTDGFTSPPKEGCWGFFRPKNPTASAGCEPADLGTKGQHATSRPPKQLSWTTNFSKWPVCSLCFLVPHYS